MRKSLLRLCVLSTPLLLGACGEGWEFQKNDVVFPYGNQRTAGSGVAYVLAKMMPEKELKVEPALDVVAQEPETVVQPHYPIADAEEIFVEAQVKSAPAPAYNYKHKTYKKAVHKSNNLGAAEGDFYISPAYEKTSGVSAQEYVQEASSIPIDVIDNKSSGLSAEEYILNAPKEVSGIEVLNIEPHAGGDGAIFSDEDTVLEVYENRVSQPIKEIVVPKKDFFDFKSDGQVSLDEIYEDPLF